jgi:hypothetical protein
MSKKQDYHVIYDSEGGWVIKKSGASRALKLFDTKEEAINWAKKTCGSESSLLIHSRDGKITGERTIRGTHKHSASNKRYSQKHN